MKYAVRQLRLKSSDPDIGVTAWRDNAPGRWSAVDYDSEERLFLFRGDAVYRVPAESVANFVLKATPAKAK